MTWHISTTATMSYHPNWTFFGNNQPNWKFFKLYNIIAFINVKYLANSGIVIIYYYDN